MRRNVLGRRTAPGRARGRLVEPSRGDPRRPVIDSWIDGPIHWPVHPPIDRRVSASARLAVVGVPAAERAELLQLHAVRVVAPVLLGDVVAVLALHAGQGDLGADI